MLNFMIVVNDGGELKSVNAAELDAAGFLYADMLDIALNSVLDKRAIAAGEYDPSDNDTPIEFVTSDQR